LDGVGERFASFAGDFTSEALGLVVLDTEWHGLIIARYT
jgi:hypothetical protein